MMISFKILVKGIRVSRIVLERTGDVDRFWLALLFLSSTVSAFYFFFLFSFFFFETMKRSN